MDVPAFTRDSRLMLFAPHPDDESLGCGVLLQRAVEAGASIRVIYATDGENNPWPQRAIMRKWHLNPGDRRRWGKLRRAEALAALRVLGIDAADVRFLSLADQKLSILLMQDCPGILEWLRALIEEFAPTHLIVPSLADAHPDHSALGVMLRLAVSFLPIPSQIDAWRYIVHGRSSAFFDHAVSLNQSEAEANMKRLAIAHHGTQLALSRRRFFAYAKRDERFLDSRSLTTPVPDGFVTWITRSAYTLRLRIRMPFRLLILAEPSLVFLGHDTRGRLRTLGAEIPVRSGRLEVTDLNSGGPAASANYRGNKFGGELEMPLSIFSTAHSLFFKIERRGLFFDQAGWIELKAPSRSDVGAAISHSEEASSVATR